MMNFELVGWHKKWHSSSNVK